MEKRPAKAVELVETDRVHRRCYADPSIFELEMRHIFERAWIYCGHESQIPRAGDYYSFNIGRQPVLMVRQTDLTIRVLYNRCAHRGTALCSDRSGNVGTSFLCPYHAWRFNLDGSLKSLPLRDGYAPSLVDGRDDAFNMKQVARVASHRGFVFASLAHEGPSLQEWLGPAKIALDSMCNRAPDGDVEIVPIGHRVVQHSNWKLFLENQVDALHTSSTHESAGMAARAIEREVDQRNGAPLPEIRPLSVAINPPTSWDGLTFVNHLYGHSLMQGYLERSQDPETLEYVRLLQQRVGKERAEEYLSADFHHGLLYPSLCVQPIMNQIRVIRPIAMDRTLTELWHFKLKGASEAIYRRYSLSYFNIINSPATLVNADDLENWRRAQRGLASDGGDWVSFQRKSGVDERNETYNSTGTSEGPMRNQFKAWVHYMSDAPGGEAV